MPVELKVPAVGESITEVQIGEWYKSEGDQVEQDENLVELETEKATFDVPSPALGVITKILKRTGDTANVGEVIGYMEQGDGAKGAKKAPAKAGKAAAEPAAPKATPADGKGKGAESVPVAQETVTQETRVMPAAERVLAERGLQPQDVVATGPGGRLLKGDVLKHEAVAKPTAMVSKAPEAPRSESSREDEIVPMSPIRRRIAQRLVEAQQNAALLTTFNEVDMSGIMEMRKRYKDVFQERYGFKLGFMSFFVKAAIEALKMVPQVNAEIRDNNIVYHNYYDIGIAVGGGKGLVVPVLRNAERMSFAEIESAIADFAKRAGENKLSVEELRGGTFTISNGGVYGSLMSTPIVNPPQSGVLGMHATQDRPVVRDGQIVIRPMMYLALTYDHRIVDGREAVTFLKRLKDGLEDPARLLIEV